MADENSALPEGTDTVVAGASSDSATENSTLVQEREGPASQGDGERPTTGGGRSESGIAGRIRPGTATLSSQAGERARGLVSQGLERSAEALGNVAKLVGDTAPGIEERLGTEYGDYARRAASAIENTANTIASKDPDELIDDTREFVRNSPGIALAGAAVVGFVVARLVKTGLGSNENEDGDED
jgi:ElaB/YqjD/DUF883 family membrane-anchored ribosome-binding protein